MLYCLIAFFGALCIPCTKLVLGIVYLMLDIFFQRYLYTVLFFLPSRLTYLSYVSLYVVGTYSIAKHFHTTLDHYRAARAKNISPRLQAA